MPEDRIHRRHMKSRTKKCLKKSGGFYLDKKNGWRVWARRGWNTEELFAAIDGHKNILAEGNEGLIKDDRRTAITLFTYMKTRICVKEYRYKGALRRLKEIVRSSKAQKGWLKGIAGFTPLALLELKKLRIPQNAFLIMESPPEYVEFRKYIKDTFENPRHQRGKKKAFIKELADFMTRLYRLKIAHRDLKISNILVKEDGNTWSFALTDWEDIRQDKKISDKRLIKELVQLNTSTPFFVSIKDRLTFLTAYFSLLGRVDTRAVYKEVMKDSEKRGWPAFS